MIHTEEAKTFAKENVNRKVVDTDYDRKGRIVGYCGCCVMVEIESGHGWKIEKNDSFLISREFLFIANDVDLVKSRFWNYTIDEVKEYMV